MMDDGVGGKDRLKGRKVIENLLYEKRGFLLGLIVEISGILLRDLVYQLKVDQVDV